MPKTAERGWGRLQNFVRRPTPTRVENSCLTPRPNSTAPFSDLNFPDETAMPSISKTLCFPDYDALHVNAYVPSFQPHSSADGEYSPNVPLACCEAGRIDSRRKPTVPGTAGSATQQTLPPSRYAGDVYFGPPPNVARGASSGGRLGGRPPRHHQCESPPAFKELYVEKPSNDRSSWAHPAP